MTVTDKRKKKEAVVSTATADLYKSLQQKTVETVPLYYGRDLYRHPTYCSQSWALDAAGKQLNGQFVIVMVKNGNIVAHGPDCKVLTDRYISDPTEGQVEVYRNGHLIMTREWGATNWGTAFNGQWVVRDIRDGSLVDNSTYSNDMIDKYQFVSE